MLVHPEPIHMSDSQVSISFFKDIVPGTTDANIGEFFPIGNGKFIFSAGDYTLGSEPAPANEDTTGRELWITDGTPEGTSLLKDINPGKESSVPQRFIDIGNGKVLFVAQDKNSGSELWITDGTTVGTTQVADIRPGENGSFPSYITTIGNDKFIFSADDGEDGSELWITDGTAAGTTQVKDINTGSFSALLSNFIATGEGTALFKAKTDNQGDELWITDGSTQGTMLLKDINPGRQSSFPFALTNIGNGKFLFSADTLATGRELWITDGTTAGTTLLKDIYSGEEDSRPADFFAVGNGKFVFSASNEANGRELWLTDGTSTGTTLLKDLSPGQNSSTPNIQTTLNNGKLLLSALDAGGDSQLWNTDGTASGTILITTINPGTNSAFRGNLTTMGNGKALFAARNANAVDEIWVTDGTATGTKTLNNELIYDDDYFRVSPIGNGLALLSAGSQETGHELWVTDGTTEGTTFVADIYVGAENAYPGDFNAIDDNRVIFSAETEEKGRELYIATAIRSQTDSTEPAPTEAESPETESTLSDEPSLKVIKNNERLQISSLDAVKALQFTLDNNPVDEVSELIIFAVDDNGQETPLGSFSLLQPEKLGQELSQVFSFDTQLIDTDTELLFKLVTLQGSQTSRIDLTDNQTALIKFGDTQISVGLNDQSPQNLLSADADSIDLSAYTGQDISLAFSIYREADFNNTVGLYLTDTADGSIIDAVSGSTLRTGDTGYREAALARALETQLTGQNGQVQTLSATLSGGGFIGMFLIADGSDAASDSLYFSHSGMNNGNDHVKMLGNNTFGFEDMAGLGDRDFNDIVIQFEVI